MKCPFHDDRTASASVNHELEGFACLACGVKGDALKLLQEQGRLSFREALERAQLLTGQEAGSFSPKPAPKRRASDIFGSR
jgi:DNA primase